LSIGGNDIGFGTMVACLTRQGDFEEIPSCRAALDDEITDAIASLEPELDGVYEAIGDASPDARVVTTQYMPLMPDETGRAPCRERVEHTGAGRRRQEQ